MYDKKQRKKIIKTIDKKKLGKDKNKKIKWKM